jgi:hypothetical protein
MCYFMLCYVMLCYDMLCYGMLCLISCYVMLCLQVITTLATDHTTKPMFHLYLLEYISCNYLF